MDPDDSVRRKTVRKELVFEQHQKTEMCQDYEFHLTEKWSSCFEIFC